jgi:hypothetical protein
MPHSYVSTVYISKVLSLRERETLEKEKEVIFFVQGDVMMRSQSIIIMPEVESSMGPIL